MPADNPLVGETWEMVDPVTGEAAQAVVSETNAAHNSVRLIARLGRRLAMPQRSFLMTWHFVQEAPNHVCAHGACDNPGFLQVHDLGTWVMVCPDHLPAHVVPLLPTDSTEGGLDHCPLCRASTHSSTSNSHEVEGVVIEHCGSCDCYWVNILANTDEEDPYTAELERGVLFGEAIGDVAPLLEQRGLRVRGVLGPVAWAALRRTTGTNSTGDHTSKLSYQGVELTIEPRLSSLLVLIGDRAKTGIQRLGGTPGREAPNTVIGVPERGTLWTPLDGGARVQVSDVQIGATAGGPGQRMTVRARVVPTADAPTREIVLGLQEFLALYQQFVSRPPDKNPKSEPPPCEVEEEWVSPENALVVVSQIVDGGITIRHENGALQTIPTYIFRTRYRKAPPRRSVYQRLMDDDD